MKTFLVATYYLGDAWAQHPTRGYQKNLHTLKTKGGMPPFVNKNSEFT